MKEGKLIVEQNKNGKIIASVCFEGKKGEVTHTLHNHGITNLKLNGKPVEFELKKGSIDKVYFKCEMIYDKNQEIKSALINENRQQTAAINFTNTPEIGPSKTDEILLDHITDIRNPAKAPYNFVPLNKKIVEAEPIPDFTCYADNRNTGWIELKITCKTPLYIRDSLTTDEIKRIKLAEETYIHSDFFSPGGVPALPGSSLRGMIRTMVEICSFGRFGFFDDKYLYFRSVADRSNLQEIYKNKMFPKDNDGQEVLAMKAGFLFRKNFKFYMQPAKKFDKITKNEVQKKLDQIGKVFEHFQSYQIEDKWIVISGHMPVKNGEKKEWLIYGKSSGSPLLLEDVDVQSYQNDKNRNDKAQLLERALNGEKVPCFYVRWKDSEGNSRITFGHTGMFRLAYEKSIGEHIPKMLRFMTYEISPDRLEKMKNDGVPDKFIDILNQLEMKVFDEKNFKERIGNIVGDSKEYLPIILKYCGKYDIAEAVFGNTSAFAGRVFFEDAQLDAGQKDVLMQEDIPKLLQTPKPTTFQHYLVQTSNSIRDRKHYNNNTAIRGNKLYWHKAGNDWIEKDQSQREKEKLITKIKPVKPGTTFTGRIRFENLSNVELGALLFALDLPEGCFHKLGMGKPIGLGSVKITPSLHLSDRKKRYTELFYEWDECPGKKDNSVYRDAFETYVRQQIGINAALWETERMKEFAMMLNYEKGCELEKGCEMEKEGKTRYMEITGRNNNEFKDRPILPLPSKV